MRSPHPFLEYGVLAFLVAVPCSSQGSTSLQGYTGLLNTPNALVAPEGTVDLNFDNQVANQWRQEQTFGSDYMVNLGLFPMLEGSLRLYEIRTPARYQNDFSAGFKLQVPFLPEWLPKLAFGVQDFGGAAGSHFFRTRYAVMTQAIGPVLLSLGAGNGPSRMKGVFGGAEWTLTPWIQLVAEHDTTDRNLGTRIRTPEGFLPHGMTLAFTGKYSLDYQPHHANVGISLRVPLATPSRPRPAGPAEREAPREGRPQATFDLPPTRNMPQAPPVQGAGTEAAAPDIAPFLAALARNLVALGFENVRTGSRGRTLVVEYENNRFNRNEMDGLGLIMGTTLAKAPPCFDRFLISLRKQNLRILDVEGPVEAIRAFFTSQAPPTETAFQALAIRRADAFGSPEGVTWSEAPSNTGWLHTRLIVAPGLRTVVGSEIGAFDYRLSLVPDLQTSLWRGAILNYRWDIPVAWTRNYSDRGAFGALGTSYILQRAWLSQAIPLSGGLISQVGFGYYDGEQKGAMGDLMWSPGTGHHRFWLKVAEFQKPNEEDRRVALAAYRYYLPFMATYIEGSAGRYYANDKGFRIEARRYFDDASLMVFYSHTNVQKLGLSITLPLTPRRDMRPGLLQVRGTDHWTYGLSTVVHNAEGNILLPDEATIPDTTVTLDRTFYNNDRMNSEYIRTNLTRLREAYQIWRELPPH